MIDKLLVDLSKDDESMNNTSSLLLNEDNKKEVEEVEEKEDIRNKRRIDQSFENQKGDFSTSPSRKCKTLFTYMSPVTFSYTFIYIFHLKRS